MRRHRVFRGSWAAAALLQLGCGGAVPDTGADAAGDDAVDGVGSADDELPLAGAQAREVASCIADNPPAEPFDLGATPDVRGDPVPVPGVDPIVLPPFTAADIAQACRDGGGSDCDEHR